MKYVEVLVHLALFALNALLHLELTPRNCHPMLTIMVMLTPVSLAVAATIRAVPVKAAMQNMNVLSATKTTVDTSALVVSVAHAPMNIAEDQVLFTASVIGLPAFSYMSSSHFPRLISRLCPLSCMKQNNQRLPKRGSNKVVELGVDSSSDCSPSDDGGYSSEGSDSDACVVCGETDGDIRICKGCSRYLHEICGGPGPCHKLCDMCSATLAKPQGKKGLRGMVEL